MNSSSGGQSKPALYGRYVAWTARLRSTHLYASIIFNAGVFAGLFIAVGFVLGGGNDLIGLAIAAVVFGIILSVFVEVWMRYQEDR